MIPSGLLPIANHLWQSTLFAGIAGLLTLLLSNNRAHARYCLWLAASAKFLIPFSLFVAAGSQIGRQAAMAPALSGVPAIIEQVHEPFGPEVPFKPVPARRSPQAASFLLPAIWGLWAAGSGVLVLSWWRQWRRLRAVIRAASPVPLAIGIPVRSSSSFLEPGVFGVFRPVLLLPDGLADHLAPAELEAILAHELSHVRRRDNLATVLHMVVEAVFWFHPLVWWLGARLMDERERACDEEVLRTGSKPKAYAEGILKVCERYLQSPLPCVAGVTGANLKKRIEAIMDNRPTFRMNLAKRLGLAAAGVLAVAIPVILGIVNAPVARAQAQSDLRFEVASVRRVEIALTAKGGVPVFPVTGGVGTSDPGRIAYRGTWLSNLMSQAFGIPPDQIIGPDWLGRERYDVVANIPEGATKEQFNAMLGNLLRDRFHLRFHIESRTRAVYVLRVANNGPKFKETAAVSAPEDAKGKVGLDAEGFPTMPPGRRGMTAMPRPGQIFMTAQDMSIAELARAIDDPPSGIDRPIIDETGLTGRYDFKLHMEWGRVTDIGAAPNVFSAVEGQLGLKLEKANRRLDHLIIDSIDREPTEN